MERAHPFEDGGGRELAYGKMSRARGRTTLRVVADDLDQAVDDLRSSWAQSRRVAWAIDRGAPARGVEDRARTIDDRLRRACLTIERDAIAAATPADHYLLREEAERRVQALERRLDAIERADGCGVLRGSELGEAAIEWRTAVGEWRSCLARAEVARPLEAHRLRRQADRAAHREGPLRDRFDALAGPERDRIKSELPDRRKAVALEHQAAGSITFSGAHPHVEQRLARLGGEIRAYERDLDYDRTDIDGIAPTVPELAHAWRTPEREPPSLDRGLVLEI